jgi:GT2 family glycosyltransferase
MGSTAVVILNYNGIGYLKQFLPAVLAGSGAAQVVVADNRSTDGSAEWLQQHHPGVNLIQLDRNEGFSRGYNLALRQVEARYYVLLNSDVEVTPGWLVPLVRLMDARPDVAACQPKIRSFTQKNQFEYAGAAGGYLDRYGYPFCRGRLFDTLEADAGQYDDDRPWTGPPGPAWWCGRRPTGGPGASTTISSPTWRKLICAGASAAWATG